MQFSAALLAGGRSSRMGRDKAFLEIDGVPLWQRQVRILRELRPFEVFIAGTARSEWIEAGLEVIADPANDAGPLAGLVAVLRRCTTPLLLALAVDLPQMTSEFLERLLSFCPAEKGVILKRGKRFEPLAAFYPLACLPLAENLLRSKHYSMQELAARAVEERLVIAKGIARKDMRLFFNLNTTGDFITLRKKLRRPAREFANERVTSEAVRRKKAQRVVSNRQIKHEHNRAQNMFSLGNPK